MIGSFVANAVLLVGSGLCRLNGITLYELGVGSHGKGAIDANPLSGVAMCEG